MAAEDVFQFSSEEELNGVQEIQSKKHKRTEDHSQCAGPEKKQRRKKAKQAKYAAIAADVGMARDEHDIDEKNQVNHAVARMNGTLFADYMARSVKRFEPNLSLVELEDLRVPQSCFLDSSQWSGLRVSSKMPEFLESSTGSSRRELQTAAQQGGAPHTLVLCSAAIRAADVTRALRCYQTQEATVAKLFAKHIKLKEAVEFTSKTRISCGVGTAQRISDLIDAGALSLSHLRHIIVDASWCGPKKRTLFEQSEAAVPSVRLLARADIKEAYQKHDVSVLVF